MTDGTKTKMVGRGGWWLNHPLAFMRRKEIFHPGRVGADDPLDWNIAHKIFAVRPEPGDCSLYLRHVEEIICSGDELAFEYVLNWLARMAQQPGEVGRVAIGLHSEAEGTGKGTFATYALGLFRDQYQLGLHNPEHVTSKFNAHFDGKIAVFADEAFFEKDHRGVGVLKALITEKEFLVERKGVDVQEPARNCTHLILATNRSRVVHINKGDRRFFLLDVSEARANNEGRHTEYFRAIHDQMANGGRAALLDILLKRDISGFDPERRPETASRARHIREGLGADGVSAAIEELSPETTIEEFKNGATERREIVGVIDGEWRVAEEDLFNLLGLRTAVQRTEVLVDRARKLMRHHGWTSWAGKKTRLEPRPSERMSKRGWARPVAEPALPGVMPEEDA